MPQICAFASLRQSIVGLCRSYSIYGARAAVNEVQAEQTAVLAVNARPNTHQLPS